MTTTPVLASTREDLRSWRAHRPGRVALVPTMGALHEGHASLVRTAREHADTVVVSVFVNPLQFGEGEDLDRYPRTLDADLALCADEGVDVVFAPSVAEVYPHGVRSERGVTVDPGALGDVLDGASRPGHFTGVLTVVAKLLGLVQPDVAVFGQKDYQQLVLIRRMVADLCLPVDVVGAPTVREANGLALSSRNKYLDEEDRRAAAALSLALRAAVDRAHEGAEHALASARAVLRDARGVDLDYLELTDPDLGPAPDAGEARLLIAARVGSTRLIDNMPLHLGDR
jgi:pantoate--beta-alanine ligase